MCQNQCKISTNFVFLEDQVSSVSPLLLYEKLQNLALKKYIIRLPQLVDGNSKKIPTLVAEENLQFVCPTLDLGLISQRLQENSDQLVNYSDCHIMWRVNFEQFNNAMRYELLSFLTFLMFYLSRLKLSQVI